ncbi:hypothetical protein POM88_032149 [Heracleum sosnowskyi]|uniref:Uncharacterized protein n=1 Tax=Heracleum sosnowskyi TaxID=360622 RepID=A0AAD8I012_9APIA|nr:hypothetical protein POM88_032149 [Heracleum sosnowskyi]
MERRFDEIHPRWCWNRSCGGSTSKSDCFNVSYGGGVDRNWKFHAVEFWRGFAEMNVEFGKGVRDVVKQSLMRDDLFLVSPYVGHRRRLRAPAKHSSLRTHRLSSTSSLISQTP